MTTKLILMMYREHISLHLPPSPPSPTDQVGDWRKRDATMHRIAADLLDTLESYPPVYVQDAERVTIELCDEPMDALLSQVLCVLEKSYEVTPGILDERGLVVADPDFGEEGDDNKCDELGCGCRA